MEYVIPYMRIEDLRNMSQTCREHKEMIEHYLSTKKKHRIEGYFDRSDFKWLMGKMTSLEHLTVGQCCLFGSVEFSYFPQTLQTLIFEDMAHLTWHEYNGRIRWQNSYPFDFLSSKFPWDGTNVLPNLKHLEIQKSNKIAITCLYDPVVDGYDEYGPKYDYHEEYMETDAFNERVPYSSFYNDDNFHKIEEASRDIFPSLERFIIPKESELLVPISEDELSKLPWTEFKD